MDLGFCSPSLFMAVDKNRKMAVNGGQECHQIDCHTLNFAWNIAPGMHLAWIGPGNLNSVKCCHFPPNASAKTAKWLLMVDGNAIDCRTFNFACTALLENGKMAVNGGQECHQIDCHTLNFAWNIVQVVSMAVYEVKSTPTRVYQRAHKSLLFLPCYLLRCARIYCIRRPCSKLLCFSGLSDQFWAPYTRRTSVRASDASV
jgi:hypothetical protein